MYKALITDLDGTAVPLTSDGSHVSETLKHTIKAAQDAGFRISCATGRDWNIAEPVIKALGLTSHCIISGGTTIIDAESGAVHWQKGLESKSTHAILEVFKKVSDGGILMTSIDPYGSPLQQIQSVSDELAYMYLIAVPETVAHQVTDILAQSDLKAIAHVTPSWNGQGFMDVHVTHIDATKEHAIKEWHKLEGVSVAETIGMGDSGNDIPIFKASGLKVAVANATPQLLAVADYIAPSVDDGALEHVIKKFLLV